jgi:TldD protein
MPGDPGEREERRMSGRELGSFRWEALQERFRELERARGLWGDCYFQTRIGHSIELEEGRIEEISSSGGEGVGVRLVRDECSSFASAPGTDGEAVAAALERAEAPLGVDLPVLAGRGGGLPARTAPPVSSQGELLHELDRLLRSLSSRVRQVTLRLRSSSKGIVIVNAEGCFADDRTYSSFSVSVVAEREGILQTGYESRCSTLPFETFLRDTDLRGAGLRAAERALRMLEADPCPAGAMPVVLSGEAGGTLIHEACGHGLEADIVRKDFSLYRGKLGERVAGELVTLVDDATIPGAYGSYAYDDEGTPAQRSVLIRGGILEAYLTDRLSCRREGLPLSGNGRRESYQNIPIPRMSNTFLLPNPGGGSAEELAERAGLGLLVRKMGGGEVNPTSGDFVFHVSEGYWIENGRIGRPVRGAVLTGNGPETLWRIRAVGEDLCLEPGMCGKGGQGAPVTDGQPTLWISELIVGGQDAGDEDLSPA